MAPNSRKASGLPPVPGPEVVVAAAVSPSPLPAPIAAAVEQPPLIVASKRARQSSSSSNDKVCDAPAAEDHSVNPLTAPGRFESQALWLNKAIGGYMRLPFNLTSMLITVVALLVYSVRTSRCVELHWWVAAYVLGVSYIGFCMSVMLHRYFSHQAYETSRVFQAILAIISCCAVQRGPVWWASKHIQHHANCDTDKDPHSPIKSGILGAVLFSVNDCEVSWTYVPKRLRQPELLLIDTFHWVPPTVFLVGTASLMPNPWEVSLMLVALPMVFCCLMTNIFNARYHDDEESEMDAECRAVDRRTDWMAILVGENLHMQHHLYPRLARRHELDLPYYLVILPLLKLGLIWNAQDLKDIDPDTAKKMKRQRLIPANADWLLLLQSNVVELLVLTASACVLYQFVRTALGI